MQYTPSKPFASWAGPRDAKLVIVGEAWGKNEHDLRKPFVGYSGKELFQMLGEAFFEIAPDLHREICELFRYDLAWVGRRDEWLAAAGIAFTNTLAFRPYNNDVKEVCCKKGDLPDDYAWPAIDGTSYLLPEYLLEVERLRLELEECRPNLVLAAGAKASWALLRDTKISNIRGGISQSTLVDGLKVLPTYHPAAVLRQWSWRPIVIADLMKSKIEMTYSDLRRPSRQILYSPTLEEVEKWTQETLASPPEALGADTETIKGQIEMISFARAPNDAIVIPFIDPKRPGYNYWPSANEELAAWNCVARLLESPIEKVWQNGLYDLQYVLPMAITCGAEEDTMLLHHSILPEMQKGLGFLGSIYTSEPSWKLMRKRKSDTVKRDE